MEEAQEEHLPEEIIEPAVEPVPHCSFCEKEITGDEKFCTHCGFPLLGTEEEQNKFKVADELKKIKLRDSQKRIKSAANTLYIIAALFFVAALIKDGNDDNKTLMLINMVVALVYVALGFWSKQKPFVALLAGLIFYVSLNVLNAFADPLSLAKGVVLKFVIIAFMVKGVIGAYEAQQMKKEMES